MQRAIAAVIEDALLAGEDIGDLKVLRRYERQRKGDNLAMLAAFDGLNRLFRCPAGPRRCAPWASAPSRRQILSNALLMQKRWACAPGAETGCAGHAQSRKHRIDRHERH